MASGGSARSTGGKPAGAKTAGGGSKAAKPGGSGASKAAKTGGGGAHEKGPKRPTGVLVEQSGWGSWVAWQHSSAEPKLSPCSLRRLICVLIYVQELTCSSFPTSGGGLCRWVLRQCAGGVSSRPMLPVVPALPRSRSNPPSLIQPLLHSHHQARPDVKVTSREVASAAGAAWRALAPDLRQQYEARGNAEKVCEVQ